MTLLCCLFDRYVRTMSVCDVFMFCLTVSVLMGGWVLVSVAAYV